jgi:hypothetical protein
LGLHLHARAGNGDDTDKQLTEVVAGVFPSIASHGFLLIASSAATVEVWFAKRDYTFSAELTGNSGAYISLSGTDNVSVLDKVGWGTQPANGFEGTALPALTSNNSFERKPAAGAGHATDSDDNVSDFNAASILITPRGTADGPQP